MFSDSASNSGMRFVSRQVWIDPKSLVGGYPALTVRKLVRRLNNLLSWGEFRGSLVSVSGTGFEIAKLGEECEGLLEVGPSKDRKPESAAVTNFSNIFSAAKSGGCGFPALPVTPILLPWLVYCRRRVAHCPVLIASVVGVAASPAIRPNSLNTCYQSEGELVCPENILEFTDST